MWSPDSKHLLFSGEKDPGGSDWWVAPLDQGQAVRTGLLQIASEQGLSSVAVNQWTADGNRILFSAKLKDTTNIWQASISPGTWQTAGPLTRVTFGNAVEVQPSAGPGGSVVYANTSESIDIWSLPMDTNRGKVNGEPAPITRDATPDDWPTLSADGKKLAFLSYRSGNADVWIKDLESRKEAALTTTPENESSPQISPDGSKVAFSVTENQKTAVYLVAAGGGIPEKVCDECVVLWHFSAGLKIIFDVSGPRVLEGEAILLGSRLSDHRAIGLLDLATREKSTFLAIPDHPVTQARFSPDGRWLSFVEVLGPVKAREIIVPFRGAKAPDRSEWIAATDGSRYDLVNWWSPDGNVLYFRSERDGFPCFWAQRLDPATKRPRGAPFPAYHFHRARLKLANVSGPTTIAAAPDKLVFPGREETGNIWMARLEGQK